VLHFCLVLAIKGSVPVSGFAVNGRTLSLGGKRLEVQVRTLGPGSCKVLNLDTSEGLGPAIYMNLNLNIGSSSCVNPVRHVRGPDHSQSRLVRSPTSCLQQSIWGCHLPFTTLSNHVRSLFVL
jgi:hypothetical protein